MDIVCLVMAVLMMCGIMAEDRTKVRYYTIAMVASLAAVVLLNVMK